ncbi:MULTISPECIES: hypothetical protein [Bacillus subtilis group]|uniref:hypothetical protein n=1 Tax=Bacillus subtilis group TaxID=653685 RepID=UPI001A917D48|nr:MULTISPECIES: hypothetical protein [Bacillus subtilis group]MCY9308735.1 hypothetical protein [Bacillus inaquosorum]BCT30304.1 hypothetical protein BVAD3_39780 [Bacillus velezensis]
MLDISANEHSVYLAKEEDKGLVTVAARKIDNDPNELYEITYFSEGVTRVIKSARLLLVRIISSLMGVDYDRLNIALRGVA